MEVKIECKCPGEHGHDTITFKERMDSHGALVMSKAVALVPVNSPMRAAEVLATLSECYLLYGITEWTLVGPDRKPLEVNESSVQAMLFEHPDRDLLVEAADEIYQEQVLLPLARRASSSSRRSPTDASTSPTSSPSTPPKKKRSTRSSISTIPTDATEETSLSPDGAYSSSQSLELVAS